MFDTRNDLPPAVRTQVVKLLAGRRADSSARCTGILREADKSLCFLEARRHGRR